MKTLFMVILIMFLALAGNVLGIWLFGQEDFGIEGTWKNTNIRGYQR